MMLVPRNSFDLFDDFFRDDDFFTRRQEPPIMKTDVKETDDKYIVEIDLPGSDKENIDLSLNNGYLKITSKLEKKEDNDQERYVRRERYYGECSRSFYVGDELTEEDILATFKNGILKIEVPKKLEQEKEQIIKRIEIKD